MWPSLATFVDPTRSRRSNVAFPGCRPSVRYSVSAWKRLALTDSSRAKAARSARHYRVTIRCASLRPRSWPRLERPDGDPTCRVKQQFGRGCPAASSLSSSTSGVGCGPGFSLMVCAGPSGVRLCRLCAPRQFYAVPARRSSGWGSPPRCVASKPARRRRWLSAGFGAHPLPNPAELDKHDDHGSE